MDARYEIRFQSLFRQGRSLCFPCDRDGRVALERLSDRARENYLAARQFVGSEYAYPMVCRAAASIHA